MPSRRIAIACQGGGINAAFTYGVLRAILRTSAEGGRGRRRFEITALSGTSAGALCAFAAWYGLAAKGDRAGSPQEAEAVLDRLWETFAARTPGEVVINAMTVQTLRAQSRGLPAVKVSPYHLAYDLLLNNLDKVGVREAFYDFAALLDAVAPDFEEIRQRDTTPRLLIGAVEVLSGAFEVFDSLADPQTRRNISLEAVRASGTLPDVRKAERIEGILCADGRRRDGYYWDGLFSHNPPVRGFVADVPLADRPDEIWVIRINPQARDDLPTSSEDIEDRRNELAGNLSLNQELHFIRAVSRWCGRCPDLALERKPITIRTIKMSKALSDSLDFASKFDRSRSFIERLRRDGEHEADAWLARWPDGVGEWPDDADYRDDQP